MEAAWQREPRLFCSRPIFLKVWKSKTAGGMLATPAWEHMVGTISSMVHIPSKLQAKHNLRHTETHVR